MKTTSQLILTIILIFSIVLNIQLYRGYDKLEYNQSKIDLPEEYKLIDKSTPIIGYIDNDSILHIEFDHSIQFKWEGSESDIPQDGIRQLQLSTNENTVYLNTVDE